MSRLLIDILAPDPFPVATLLAAAVGRAQAVHGSQAAVARAAGLTPAALSRALQDGAEARPSTVRAVLRVAGMHLAVLPGLGPEAPARPMGGPVRVAPPPTRPTAAKPVAPPLRAGKVPYRSPDEHTRDEALATRPAAWVAHDVKSKLFGQKVNGRRVMWEPPPPGYRSLDDD